MRVKQISDLTQAFRVISPFSVNEEVKYIKMLNKSYLIHGWGMAAILQLSTNKVFQTSVEPNSTTIWVRKGNTRYHLTHPFLGKGWNHTNCSDSATMQPQRKFHCFMDDPDLNLVKEAMTNNWTPIWI